MAERPAKYKHYSDRAKTEAVTAFLTLGSLQLVSDALKIPLPTLQSWRNTAWWGEVVQEVKSTENLVLSARLRKVFEKSLDIVEDRLEHGDFFYDQKLGQLVRKDVNLRDAANIAQMASQQRINILSQEQHQVAQETMQQKLDKLAESFASWAKMPKKEELIVVEEIDEGEPPSLT